MWSIDTKHRYALIASQMLQQFDSSSHELWSAGHMLTLCLALMHTLSCFCITIMQWWLKYSDLAAVLIYYRTSQYPQSQRCRDSWSILLLFAGVLRQHQHCARAGGTCYGHAANYNDSFIPVQSHIRRFPSMLLTCCHHVAFIITCYNCTWHIHWFICTKICLQTAPI